MSTHRAFLVLVVFLVGIVMVSACSPALPTPDVQPTSVVVNQPEATATAVPPSPSPAPSATPTSEPPTPTSSPTHTETPQPYGPDNFPAGMNPLTGLRVSDAKLLERRPMVVKIQLFPRQQRPSWGVSQADIVFDYYQNNGMTRLNAVFYGNDAEKVGPIRSGRLFDSHVVQMVKGIFAFGGADQRILNRFYSSDFSDRMVVEGRAGSTPLKREDPNGYNYLKVNTTELSQYATEKGISNTRPNLDGMTFFVETPENGQPGVQLYTRFSISAYSRWDFDPAAGRYLRFQDTQEDQQAGAGEGYAPLIDQYYNQQASAANVVVLLVPHEFAYRSAGSEIVDIKLLGSGLAYAFRDGQVYELKWSRPDSGSLVTLTFGDGSAYPLKPGNTWFEVVGQSSLVEKNEGGSWRVTAKIP